MSNKSPVFPMPDPQHFSDYGFDPQINYLQVLEEAMRLKRDTSSRSIDSIHFRLQKPNDSSSSSRTKVHHKPINKKKRWWRNALFFFKWRRWPHHHRHDKINNNDVHQARARTRASLSGPLYLTESRSGPGTPYRTTSRPSSGPLAGTLTAPVKGDLHIPYFSLRELTTTEQQQRMSTSAMPVYLVT